MPQTDSSLLITTPIASLVLVDDDALREKLALRAIQVPSSLKQIIFSMRSAAYIDGLTKSYDLAESKGISIAFVMLRVLIGDIALAKLAATLSSELQIPNDKAQRMAQEIEHDLIGPVAGELNHYLAGQKQQQAASAATSARQAGATNVLDLKQQPKRPLPPPIPRLPKP